MNNKKVFFPFTCSFASFSFLQEVWFRCTTTQEWLYSASCFLEKCTSNLTIGLILKPLPNCNNHLNVGNQVFLRSLGRSVLLTLVFTVHLTLARGAHCESCWSILCAICMADMIWVLNCVGLCHLHAWPTWLRMTIAPFVWLTQFECLVAC